MAILLVPASSAFLYASSWVKSWLFEHYRPVGGDRWIAAFGDNVSGTTQLSYLASTNLFDVNYRRGWTDVPPKQWAIRPIPGLQIERNVVALNDPRPRGDVSIYVKVDHWLALAANLPILVGGLFLLRRAARLGRAAARGKCPVCGYDLRATPDRCPECGMVTAPDGAR